MSLGTAHETCEVAVFAHGLDFGGGLHGKEAGKVVVHQ